MPDPKLAALLAALWDYCASNFPGMVPGELRIRFTDNRKTTVPIPSPPAQDVPNGNGAVPPAFVPTVVQRAILAALDGKALRSEALARACHIQKSQLYATRGALTELRERGLVDHHERLGYYRPDAPPPELGQ